MKPSIIRVPSYMLNDNELIDLHQRLTGFAATGSTDDKDELAPESRAVDCRADIQNELRWRNRATFATDSDGNITVSQDDSTH